MALYLGSVVINVGDIEKATAFWTAALHYEVRSADATFAVLTDPQRRWANVSLQLWLGNRVGRNRLHLDLYSDDQQGEVERLLELGATRLPWNYPPDADYIVLADPDGNEFCVVASDYGQD